MCTAENSRQILDSKKEQNVDKKSGFWYVKVGYGIEPDKMGVFRRFGDKGKS